MSLDASRLIGSRWKHRKKQFEYTVKAIKGDMVRLHAETKGARSTWKYYGLLEFDYEMVQNGPVSPA